VNRRLAKWVNQSLIDSRYFADIWYVVENWLTQIKARNIVEVGSSSCSRALLMSGRSVMITDPNLEVLRRIQQNATEGRFEQAEPTAIPMPDCTFDAVVSVNMLEFCDKQPMMLDEIKRLLRPGGKAIIATINHKSLWRHAVGALRDDDPPRPTKTLTKRDLLYLLKQAGFSVDSYKERAPYLPLGKAMARVKLPIPAGVLMVLVRRSKDVGAEKTKVSKAPHLQ
jgi:SAM-dependent methyltransferase